MPRPPQVFAIGLNYKAHAQEGIFSVPEEPTVFTKWPSCIVGPSHAVELPVDTDWEIELVVAISRRAYKVSAADAMSYVAGYTVGQDLSDRVLQRKGPAPQWGLGKSRYGYGPTGPWLVTLDEFDDPHDLAIHSSLAGETLQTSRTSMLIFDIPTVIEYISALCPLLPGDLIFTGTPEGVGYARTPPRFLHPGDVLTSTIEGIGDLVTHFAICATYAQVSSVFWTLPMALRGNTSTTRTSRGRLCTESSAATWSIKRSRRRGRRRRRTPRSAARGQGR